MNLSFYRYLFLVGFWPALVQAQAEPVQGFPVYGGGKNTSPGMVLADLDGYGRHSIIAVTDEGINVLDSTGVVRKGFPLTLLANESNNPSSVNMAPAVCDVDGDGKLEIVALTANGYLWSLETNGELTAGFPMPLPGYPKGGLSCHTYMGKTELLFTVDAGVLLRWSAGRLKVVAKLGRGVQSGVAIADIDQDGVADYIVGGGDAQIHVLHRTGKTLKGFPYKMAFRNASTPSIGDINDDGSPDIVVGSLDYHIHAIDQEGKTLTGFPVKTGYRIYSGVALADLNGDFILDLVVGSGDRKLYGLQGNGRALMNFPIKLNGRIAAEPVIADLDQDGRYEIAVTTQKGDLHIFTDKGKPFLKKPIRLGGNLKVAPAVARLDGQESFKLVATSTTGVVHAYSFAAKAKLSRGVAWPMVAHSTAHTGRFWPNPGRFKNLDFKEKILSTTNPIVTTYKHFDLDGDAEKKTQIRWYVDDVHRPRLNNRKEILPTQTKKNQRWNYSLQGWENFSHFGEGTSLSKVEVSKAILIHNSPPGPPKVELSPKSPKTTDALKVGVTQYSQDADQDTITYSYRWQKDYRFQNNIKTSEASISANLTKKGQTWRVVVVPHDGEVEGEPTSLALTIVNTIPTAPKIRAIPNPLKRMDELKVVFDEAASDADGDKLWYDYVYYDGKRRLNASTRKGVLPAATLRKGKRIEVRVRAHDDENAGPVATTDFVVINTAPLAPKFKIIPEGATTSDTLALGIVSQSKDVDGDPVAYRHQWRLNGEIFKSDYTIPAKMTKKGQRWSLELIAQDGQSDGEPGQVEMMIGNTPPVAPVIVIDDYNPPTDAVVVPRIAVPASDADGDLVTIKYSWTLVRKKKSQIVKIVGKDLQPIHTKKGQKWILEARAHDGDVQGNNAKLQFSIRNTAPTKPSISLSSYLPHTEQTVAVKIDKPSSDKDGDSLHYRYRWFKNQELMSEWASDKSKIEANQARKGEFWRVEVTAFDGEVEGRAVGAEFRVVNRAPLPPSGMSVQPKRATTVDDLTCSFTTQGRDVDGDSLRYTTHWYRQGKVFDISDKLKILPSEFTSRGESWQCAMRAFDGEYRSDEVLSGIIKITNAKPREPSIAVEPPTPTTRDTLSCDVTKASDDPDFDPIRYKFTWFKNGKLYSQRKGEPTHQIDRRKTQRGDKWRCIVTPNDPSGTGREARSSVTIENSKPTMPLIKISPLKPHASDDLVCEIKVASLDADRDKLEYRYTWFLNKRKQAYAMGSREVPKRLVRAGSRWRCEVRAFDGIDMGAVVVSETVRVAR
jgi:hypothetical protein